MELGTRRRRCSSEPGLGGGADYLSALPEDLLLLVLVRLGCAAAAARTGLLARRWRGLWSRLRDLAFRDIGFPSLRAVLDRVARSPPTVSLLEIRVPSQNSREQVPAAGAVTSLLRAAARLAPEKLVFALQSESEPSCMEIDLPCFHRATSIVLKSIPFVLRAPATGGDFTALQDLSLLGCIVGDLEALLSLCPHLRVLRLKTAIWLPDHLRVHSALLQELVMDLEMMWAHGVDIVAPMLKQLKMSVCAQEQVSISILTPMVDKFSWQCLYDKGIIGFGIWYLEKLRLQMAETQGQLPTLHIHACNSYWYSFSDEAANFAQEIEKHMVADFSALELHLTTRGHVFGALVSHFLGLNRIRSVTRRLKTVLHTSQERKACSANCRCQPTNWRTQIMSLTALEEVEIDGFEGEDHELDFLKLVFSCAPLLKKVIVKLSDEVPSNDDRCTDIYNIFRGYSSVKCNVYVRSGLMHRSQGCRLT